MSVLISDALINGAGTPIPACHIKLKSCINTLQSAANSGGNSRVPDWLAGGER